MFYCCCFFTLENYYDFAMSGPPLPKALCCHSMVEIDGDLFVIGGQNDVGEDQKSIHQLQLSSGNFSWRTLNQELTIARILLVGIPLGDAIGNVNCQ